MSSIRGDLLSNNLTVKDSYRLHLLLRRFKTTTSTKRPTTSQIYRHLKIKASTRQHAKIGRSRKQNSKKAPRDTSITPKEINNLEKLVLEEEEDYNETSRFIETSLRMHTTKEDREVLRTAYENFIRVDVELQNVIISIENDTLEQDLNVSRMINNNRSIIVKELSNVCDKLSNLMIKEAYLHHLDEFKTHAKPKIYTQRFINQKESPEIFFKMKGGSGSASSKSPNSVTKQPHINEDFDGDDFHDHTKCIEEERERRFPRYGRIGNWDPIYEGKGADLLHAPVNHSIKEEEHQSYYDMMREEGSKPRDIFHGVVFDLFDF